MKKHLRNIAVAAVCFLVVLVLNFALPRMLPGDPVAYLTGMAEEDMTAAQYEYYRDALGLDDGIVPQFLKYIQSLLDGTLGYSYKKQETVSSIIGRRVGATLQITVPAVVLSALIGLVWGLYCGMRKDSAADKISTAVNIALNSVPAFLAGLLLVVFFCFKAKLFPYTGLSSYDAVPGTARWFADRLHHLVLPVLTLVIASAPSRYLLMRWSAAEAAEEKYVLYARTRGLSLRKIRLHYVLRNIVQPYITTVGMSVSTCVGGSLVVENIFSINGMGKLLSEAVYSLDYPLMQGILFVTTLVMVISIIVTDILCIVIDPRVRLGEGDK